MMPGAAPSRGVFDRPRPLDQSTVSEDSVLAGVDVRGAVRGANLPNRVRHLHQWSEQEVLDARVPFVGKGLIVDAGVGILVVAPVLGAEYVVPDTEQRTEVRAVVPRLDRMMDAMGLRSDE